MKLLSRVAFGFMALGGSCLLAAILWDTVAQIISGTERDLAIVFMSFFLACVGGLILILRVIWESIP